MSRRHLRALARPGLATAGAVVAVLAFATCGPAETTDQTSLTLAASPRVIAGDGTTTDITVIATEKDGSNGTGSVNVTTAHGKVDGAPLENSFALANGRASFTYGCSIAEEAACLGQMRINAEWKGQTAAVRIEVTAPAGDGGTNPTGDGGSGADSGTANADGGGGTDGGTTGSDAGLADASAADAASFVTLSAYPAGKTKLYVGVGDFVELTAAVRKAPAPDAGVIPNSTLEFTSSVALVAEVLDGGSTATPSTGPLDLATGPSGSTKVRVVENGTVGAASVTATDLATGAGNTFNLQVVTIASIKYSSTLCNNTACTVMGVKGSGFNDTATVSFLVTDATGLPVGAGVPVNFTLNNKPTGTTCSSPGLTNAQGIASTNVASGNVNGIFSVHAEVAGQYTDSPSIGVRGAKPSNQGFNFTCSPTNVAAWNATQPPAYYQITCSFTLVDRFGNPVGTGTPVYFLSEAGNVPNSAPSIAYPQAGEGTGTVKLTTTGGRWPPVDVAPLPADDLQIPLPRAAEPSVQEGQYLIHNPRDGLVTVIAYVQGEEYFYDKNSNGVRDPDEMFIDQGEPFVDTNDNGVWDDGEPYFDQVAPGDTQGNGHWDPPNGQWDANTTVWAETHVLFTDLPRISTATPPAGSYYYNSQIVPNFFQVAQNTSTLLDVFFADRNLNRIQAGATFSVSHTASKGTVTWKGGQFLDLYGFDINRRLVSATDGSDCNAQGSTALVCYWKTQFQNWDQGKAGQVEIKGTTSGTPAWTPDTINVTSTLLQVPTTISVDGQIQ